VDHERSEEVRLTMPASPDLLRVARLTAAGLANRVGFNIDEVEDVKIALDELCFSLVGDASGGGTLDLRFVLEPGALVIEGAGPANGGPDRDADTRELSALILDAVVDEHEISREGEEVRFRLVKHQTAG
jgi:serine/threonine-protein kinase RsbW